MSRLIRKPTPQELAQYIDEDRYGLPLVFEERQIAEQRQTSQAEFTAFAIAPSPASPATDPASALASDPAAQHMGAGTQMRTCGACNCMNNAEGNCRLDTIEINEHGGCAMFEAGEEMADDGPRYQEEETNDGTGAPTLMVVQPMNDQDPSHKPTNGPWDPRGGGY